VAEAGGAEQGEGVDVGLAVAFGLELGCLAPPLLAQRWEEHWERPLADWREELGISALLQRSPFRSTALKNMALKDTGSPVAASPA
ncbi:MAG: hypothetical protein ACK5FE_03170, partial [Cyanobacteriota bacterium]